ncbi:hypothetical protein KBP52_01560 [Pseudomonas sp. SCA2728.1_7]|nr:hypothetical protein KBP52_01560 [Pseudomonas sp. SCA2728.1_7]
MLNDYGKSLFKPWCSVQNVTLVLALVFVVGLTIKTYALNSSEIASWVQAFGSVAAIIVAAYFPVWHGRKELQRRHQSLAEILRVLSDDATESLHLLASAFACPHREKKEMMRYETFHRGRDWQALTDQLSQIPVSELTPQLARDLSYVKDAVEFGSFVAAQIPEWMRAGGYSRPDVVRVLRTKRDLVGVIRSRLPVPLGVESPELSQAQLATQVSEMKRPNFEPLAFDDAEVYRRYVWDDYRWPLPQRVFIHGVYPYFNDFGPSYMELPPNFFGMQEIEEYVRSYCRILHEEHLESEMMRESEGAL